MKQELVALKHELGRGGALCKEFKRTRLIDEMDWRVEMHYALAAIDRSPQLQRCEPHSVGRALIDLGVMGLTLSPAMRLAYLIPYSIKVSEDRRVDTCTVSPSYMGMEQIAYRTGFVELIQTVLVREGDKFRVTADDDGRHILHAEGQVRRGVSHAYCIAWFSSGRKHIEVMDRDDLLACREAAARANNNKVPFAWSGKFRGEMYKKAVLRRAWKHWPRVTNPKLAAMMDAVGRTDPMEFAHADKIVSQSETLDQEQINVLIQMMADAGIPNRGHDSWLQALAARLGYEGIRKVLTEDFDGAVQLMEEGLTKWTQSHTSTASDSKPEDSTQREEAA